MGDTWLLRHKAVPDGDENVRYYAVRVFAMCFVRPLRRSLRSQRHGRVRTRMRDGGAGHFGFVTTILESLLRQAPLKRSCRSNAGALPLGESELGTDRVLGQSGCFALYSFNVQVARILADRERRQLRAIVENRKPAHTHSVYLNGPCRPACRTPGSSASATSARATDLH